MIVFQRLTDKLDSETIPVFIDEPDCFRGCGLNSATKNLSRLSAVRLCRVVSGFHDVAWRFRQPYLCAGVQDSPL